ncbi:MAG: nitrate ABC transporter ATP-binding protein [Candidatus Tectimicrobiota bacterium]|nr:MAG: nitrate ABC transporter ATP-binding protein [Candidatus Tectomicrobia bacterium]
MPHIEIVGITKVYEQPAAPPIVALDGVDLTVEHDQFVSLVGPSGCGKSTLLHLVGGFISPSTGEIRIDGRPVTGPGPDRGIVFQNFALFPWLTVRGNVEYGLAEKGIPRRERRKVAQHFIDMVKLTGFEEVYPHRLSGGMQQRVALARMLACDPQILLMDEPFGALDAQTRLILQEELKEIWRQARKTVLFVTHDVREAVFLSQRVVVMTARPGRIKEIVDTDLPADAPRLAVDALAEDIWATLREEVLKAVVPGDRREQAP